MRNTGHRAPPRRSAGHHQPVVDRGQLRVASDQRAGSQRPAVPARIVDSAAGSNADDCGVAFRKRNPQQFRALLPRIVVLYHRLVPEWSVTVERYSAAVPEFTSVDSWTDVKASDRIAGSAGVESEG